MPTEISFIPSGKPETQAAFNELNILIKTYIAQKAEPNRERLETLMNQVDKIIALVISDDTVANKNQILEDLHAFRNDLSAVMTAFLVVADMSSQRLSKGAKLVIGIGIAAGVGLLGYWIYRGTKRR